MPLATPLDVMPARRPVRGARVGNPARLRAALAALVLLLHAALLAWWLHGDRRAARATAELPRVSVRLLAALQPTVVAPPATATRAPTRARPAAPRPPQDPAAAATAPAAREPQAITLAAPQPAASQPAAASPPSLMDGEATRRAIRAAAREPGIATQAGRQGAALQTPDERLGSEVQRSARGDCLKGEYAGGGMGLLSLPFLAAAALSDQCRH